MLRSVQWFVRGIQFCCASLVFAVYSYVLATLHNHNLGIANWIRAVEGISGAAVVYTAIGLFLLCCLAGFPLTSSMAIVLDLAFLGAFVYVATANRGGAGSCTGTVDTPFGTGDASSDVPDNGNGGFTALPNFGVACRLESACLAVSIIAIFFFLFSAITELALARHRQKEKRFGPGPHNDYTSGSGRRRRGLLGWFGRRRNHVPATANENSLPEHTHPDQVRDSCATETTQVGRGNEGVPTRKYGESEHRHSGPEGAALPPGNHGYDDGVYTSRV